MEIQWDWWVGFFSGLSGIGGWAFFWIEWVWWVGFFSGLSGFGGWVTMDLVGK